MLPGVRQRPGQRLTALVLVPCLLTANIGQPERRLTETAANRNGSERSLFQKGFLSPPLRLAAPPAGRLSGQPPLMEPFGSQGFDFAHPDALSVVEGQALAESLECSTRLGEQPAIAAHDLLAATVRPSDALPAGQAGAPRPSPSWTTLQEPFGASEMDQVLNDLSQSGIALVQYRGRVLVILYRREGNARGIDVFTPGSLSLSYVGYDDATLVPDQHRAEGDGQALSSDVPIELLSEVKQQLTRYGIPAYTPWMESQIKFYGRTQLAFGLWVKDTHHGERVGRLMTAVMMGMLFREGAHSWTSATQLRPVTEIPGIVSRLPGREEGYYGAQFETARYLDYLNAERPPAAAPPHHGTTPSQATIPALVWIAERLGGQALARWYLRHAWWLESLLFAVLPPVYLVHHSAGGLPLFKAAAWAVGLALVFAAGHRGRAWLERNYGIWPDGSDISDVSVAHALGIFLTLAAFSGTFIGHLWLLPLVPAVWWAVFMVHKSANKSVAMIDLLPTDYDAILARLRDRQASTGSDSSETESSARLLYCLKKYAGTLASKRAVQIEPRTATLLLTLREMGMIYARGLKADPGGLPVQEGDILCPPIDLGHGQEHLVFSDGALDSTFERAHALRFLREAARLTAPGVGINIHVVHGEIPVSRTDLKIVDFECIDQAAWGHGILVLRRLALPETVPVADGIDPLRRAFARLRNRGLGNQGGITTGVIFRPVVQDEVKEARVDGINADHGRAGWKFFSVVATHWGLIDVDKLSWQGVDPRQIGSPEQLVGELREKWMQKVLYNPAFGLFADPKGGAKESNRLIFVGALQDAAAFHHVSVLPQAYESLLAPSMNRVVDAKDQESYERTHRLITGETTASHGPIQMMRFKYVLVPEPLVPLAREYFSDVMLPWVIPVKWTGDRWDYETGLREILSLEKDPQTIWWATSVSLSAGVDPAETPVQKSAARPVGERPSRAARAG